MTFTHGRRRYQPARQTPPVASTNVPARTASPLAVQLQHVLEPSWCTPSAKASAPPHRHGPDYGHQDAIQPGAAPAVQRSTVHDVLRGGGRPLDDATRTDMETRFGADFSNVRIHTDAAAKASAPKIGARAYTSGNHIVLGEGGGDRHTLAHELTHVIQQRKGPVAGNDNGSGLKVSDPSDRFEREAETQATRVMSRLGPRHDTAVQRSAAPGAGHSADDQVVLRMWAVDPRRGAVGAQTEKDLDPKEIKLTKIVLEETKSKQGEHVFNAFNALALQVADTLAARARESSELTAALEALRAGATALGALRDCKNYPETFRAAPGGKGNAANATSYSAYAEQIRAAVDLCLPAPGTETTPARPVNRLAGWSRLVPLSHRVLDRAIDQDALRYNRDNQKSKEKFDQWTAETKDAMTKTFSLLLNAVAVAFPKPAET